MSVKIRLARFGKNKVPFYHVVVTDSRNRRDSKFIEKLGYFDPLLEDTNKHKLVLDNERVEYWLGVGAQPSDRVALLLIQAGVKGAEKFKPQFTPKTRTVKEKKAKKVVEASITPATATEGASVKA